MTTPTPTQPRDAGTDPSSGPLRMLFLNENLGGHATMHRAIRATIGAYPEVVATFVDVPPRRLIRRIAGAGIPPLDRLDLDFAALRSQLAVSLVARRLLRRFVGTYDLLHVYTQHAVLLSAATLASTPTIVSTDATGEQVGLVFTHPRQFLDPADHFTQRLPRRFLQWRGDADRDQRAGCLYSRPDHARTSTFDHFAP